MTIPPMPLRSFVLENGFLSRVWRDWLQAFIDAVLTTTVDGGTP